MPDGVYLLPGLRGGDGGGVAPATRRPRPTRGRPAGAPFDPTRRWWRGGRPQPHRGGAGQRSRQPGPPPYRAPLPPPATPPGRRGRGRTAGATGIGRGGRLQTPFGERKPDPADATMLSVPAAEAVVESTEVLRAGPYVLGRAAMEGGDPLVWLATHPSGMGRPRWSGSAPRGAPRAPAPQVRCSGRPAGGHDAPRRRTPWL